MLFSQFAADAGEKKMTATRSTDDDGPHQKKADKLSSQQPLADPGQANALLTWLPSVNAATTASKVAATASASDSWQGKTKSGKATITQTAS